MEDDLRQEEEKQQSQVIKEIRMQEYHRAQKDKLADFQKIKYLKEID